MKRTVVYFLFFFSLLHKAAAQSYTPVHYSVPEGLPSNEVYQVFQDSKGFIWFATDVGVVKFDGTEMQKIGTQEGLTDPVVFGFFEDYKGRIWFRTFSGRISYYEDQQIHPYRYNDALVQLSISSVISAIAVDSLDQLWFSTYENDGVYGRIDSAGHVYTEYPLDCEMYCHTVGNAKLAGYRQLRPKKISIDQKIYPIETEANCGHIQIKSVHWRGKQYISMCRRLFEFDGTGLKIVLTTVNPIITLSADHDGYLWVGALNSTISRYSDPSFKEKWEPDFVKGLSVTSVLQDSEGAHWFSTLEQGVFYIPDFSIQTVMLHEKTDGATNTKSKIRNVDTLGDDVLVGFVDGNVLTFTKNAEKKASVDFGKPIRTLYVDSNDDLWLVHSETAYYLSKDFKLKKEFEGQGFFSFSERNGRLYALTGRTWLIDLNRNKLSMQAKSTDYAYRVLCVDDSLLLLATRDGLHLYDLDRNFIREESEFRNQKINCILKIAENTFFIGTVGNGFSVFNPATGKANRFFRKKNFVANNIYTAILSGNWLWIATERGVAKINREALLQGNPEHVFISRQHGLINNQINHLLDAGEYIWAFSDIGFSLLDKDVAAHSPAQPKFYLKSFTAGNTSLQSGKEIELPASQNDVQIDFGFISFQNPHIFMRYRLHETDPWTYTENKNLHFNSLAPTDYTFELQHSTDNVKWTPSYRSPMFTVLPPLWQTWYFITGVSAFFLVLIFLYFRNQVMTYKRHQLKLIQSELSAIEKERSRIAKDLHDSVGTDFTSIKMSVGQLLKKYNEPKTDEIESQFQGTIQEIKTIIYGLAPPGLERYGLIAGLKNYVGKLDGAIPVNIKFDSFGPDIKDASLSITVFRIVQELISNSLKHSNADTISLHVNSFEDLLSIVYEDNGKGFSWETSGKGLGLYNIESRLQSVKGRLKFDSGEFGISYTIDIPLNGAEFKTP